MIMNAAKFGLKGPGGGHAIQGSEAAQEAAVPETK